MFRIGVLVLLTSCVYEPPVSDDQVDDTTNPEPQPIEAACFASGSLLCLEFERPDGMTDSQALDGSGNNFHAMRTGVTDFQRLLSPPVEDDDAVGFAPSSRLEIDRELGLTGAVTIELWAQTGFSNTVMFDSSGRLYLARNANGELECGINGGGGERHVTSERDLDGDWHHLACTLDTDGNLKVFIDGDVDDCKELDESIDASRTGKTRISGGLAGAVDSVHAYLRALTPAEICGLAGETSCDASCPSSNGGPGGPGGGPGGD